MLRTIPGCMPGLDWWSCGQAWGSQIRRASTTVRWSGSPLDWQVCWTGQRLRVRERRSPCWGSSSARTAGWNARPGWPRDMSYGSSCRRRQGSWTETSCSRARPPRLRVSGGGWLTMLWHRGSPMRCSTTWRWSLKMRRYRCLQRASALCGRSTLNGLQWGPGQRELASPSMSGSRWGVGRPRWTKRMKETQGRTYWGRNRRSPASSRGTWAPGIILMRRWLWQRLQNVWRGLGMLLEPYRYRCRSWVRLESTASRRGCG